MKPSVHMRAGSMYTQERFLAVFRRDNLNDRGDGRLDAIEARQEMSQGYSLHYDHHPAQPRVEEEDRVHRERAPLRRDDLLYK